MEGRKWDMGVVLAKAATFLQNNPNQLDTTADSQKFAFRWLKLADAAGLQDACQACVDRIVSQNSALCIGDRLQGAVPSNPAAVHSAFGSVSSCSNHHKHRPKALQLLWRQQKLRLWWLR